MSSHHRIIHPQETYRFSMTHTLRDYPLLIGEILRRDEVRALQQAKRRAILRDLQRSPRPASSTSSWHSQEPVGRLEPRMSRTSSLPGKNVAAKRTG
jgi:hypothetical protein